MKNLIIILIALGIPNPQQDRPPSREPPVKQNAEAVFFRNETEEYFKNLNRFGPNAKQRF